MIRYFGVRDDDGGYAEVAVRDEGVVVRVGDDGSKNGVPTWRQLPVSWDDWQSILDSVHNERPKGDPE